MLLPHPKNLAGAKDHSSTPPPWNSVSAVASVFALNLEAEVTATRALFLLVCGALAQLAFAVLPRDARPWANNWPLGPWLGLADTGSPPPGWKGQVDLWVRLPPCPTELEGH